MRLASIFLFGFFSLLLAQAQTDTEIFLFDVKSKKGTLTLTNPRNITNHKGYDNQPSFHRTEPLLYYSSFNDEGRSDIKSFNYKTKQTAALTQTQEREYSPTLTPDGKFVSCIIQRDNNAQDLGMYPATGGTPAVLINHLIVGYHAWMDSDRILMFILGQPQTLRLHNLKTEEDKTLDENIGRSLHSIPGKNAMSYVKKVSETQWSIFLLDKTTLASNKLMDTLPQREDLCWTPDGKVIMSDGTKVFIAEPFGEKQWVEISLPAEFSGKGITRLAMNAKGDKLAVVVAE
ncbi:MAG: TolB family protein [Flammeovirgaceae bacterium]